MILLKDASTVDKFGLKQGIIFTYQIMDQAIPPWPIIAYAGAVFINMAPIIKRLHEKRMGNQSWLID